MFVASNCTKFSSIHLARIFCICMLFVAASTEIARAKSILGKISRPSTVTELRSSKIENFSLQPDLADQDTPKESLAFNNSDNGDDEIADLLMKNQLSSDYLSLNDDEPAIVNSANSSTGNKIIRKKQSSKIDLTTSSKPDAQTAVNISEQKSTANITNTIQSGSNKDNEVRTVASSLKPHESITIYNEQSSTQKDFNFIKSPNKIILFVWDGLRPDVITQENTPNLYKLKQAGSFFSDHHSSYPTVTMNNANSFATGNYSGGTGFYGNRTWRPDIANLGYSDIDFNQPVFTQEHYVLQGLQQEKAGKPLMYVDTLIQIARKYGLKTAQVGKAGPIALQDAHLPSQNGVILTPHKIYPSDFAKKLQRKGYFIPKKAVSLYPETDLQLREGNPDPTTSAEPVTVKTIDGKIPLTDLSDPSLAKEALVKDANEYMMNIFLKEILPEHKPDISIVWFREPDTTEHKYGPGSKPFYQALRNQDKLLGKLLLYMDKLGIAKSTNLLIASDHGHSNVSGDIKVFPLRDISSGAIGDISADGYSVSGQVRLADLLTKAGFNAYDGYGCLYNPVLHGVFSDGNLSHAIKVDDDGKICNENRGKLYTTQSYKVPKDLPKKSVIVATNGGSAYLYVPDKDPATIKNLVTFLQSRQEFDCIFADNQHGDLAGTLPIRKVQFFDDQQARHPDILVSMSYDDKQVVQGLPGTVYTTGKNSIRGSHGSLSPIDIKNVFMAFGPNFKTNYVDILPTANVDVAVTMAYLLNLPFEGRAGRPVLEAVKGSGIKSSDYKLVYSQLQPFQPATGLKIHSLKSYDKEDFLVDKDSYTFVLNTKQLYFNESVYHYIDSGKAIRY